MTLEPEMNLRTKLYTLATCTNRDLDSESAKMVIPTTPFVDTYGFGLNFLLSLNENL